PAFSRYRGEPLDPADNAAHFLMIRQALIDYYRSVESIESEQMRLERLQGLIHTDIGRVARNVLLVRDGYVEGSRLGDLCRALHSHWKFSHAGHDAMTADEFEAKHRWLDEVNSEIMAGRIPRWLA